MLGHAITKESLHVLMHVGKETQISTPQNKNPDGLPCLRVIGSIIRICENGLRWLSLLLQIFPLSPLLC